MAAIEKPHRYELRDNLVAEHDRVFLTGTQALVRMLLSQRRRDRLQGIKTAGFVSGYRGSPLGGVDQALWRSQQMLAECDIRFLPAVNEDLAATMVMGTQQAGRHADRTVDGVFAMWYGKGPGLDRSGDALHHGNAAGASRLGGVLLIVGDDHIAASSSIPHASDATLASWAIPVIHPASVEDYEHFGLWGWAASRFSGAWIGFKAITETVESGRSFVPAPVPEFAMPPEAALRHRREYSAKEFLTPAIEERMEERLDSIRLFHRHHPLDRMLDPAPKASLGIVSVGKAALDVTEALQSLRGKHPGLPLIRHLQIGLVWPLDGQSIAEFAQGLHHILVVEEKAPIVEGQIKDVLFNARNRPSVSGKRDPMGRTLIPIIGQFAPSQVTGALLRWVEQSTGLHLADTTPHCAPAPKNVSPRRPYFCSGCPHSTSTRVPEGSHALGGVGCHYMASWMDRNTSGLTQMGGEGADWLGVAPFIREGHIFQNMGEGTYFHSGLLAIRQAVAANADMTYKILFNDAVAMTGGQPVDGPLTVPSLCQQVLGEGVKRVVVTTDDPDRYRHASLPEGVRVHHRRDLDAVQRELREIKGITVLIHDQTCAAEKRRRRKKGLMQEPSRRLFINTAVCEGCGDCGVQSNCLSIVPVETPLGRKRAIDQSTCNKDYTCADGFCPSFVSVEGGRLRQRRAAMTDTQRSHIEALIGDLPAPESRADRKCNLLVVGVGGTGVVTIGAIVSMAAHLEGRAASVLDMTGLAQKGGAVVSHVRIGDAPESTGPVRIDVAAADTAILCDAVAALKPEAWQTLAHDRTLMVLNTYIAPPAEFTRDTEAIHDPAVIVDHLRRAVGSDRLHSFDAHTLAERFFGNSILSNMILLGHAWQLGAIPVDLICLHRAIQLNGVAVDVNRQAFQLGRLAAWRPDELTSEEARRAQATASESLNEIMQRHQNALTAYQDAAYARRYAATVTRILESETKLRPQRAPELAMAVAHSLYKLMAVKDEFEVARLYTDGEFRRQLQEQFEGDYRLRFHMAPPLLARRDPGTGKPRKMVFGPYMEGVFRILAKGRKFRGTWLDIFSWQAERKAERRLLQDFEQLVGEMAEDLNSDNYAEALAMARLPLAVRGFGHVKAANIHRYHAEISPLRQRFTTAAAPHLPFTQTRP